MGGEEQRFREMESEATIIVSRKTSREYLIVVKSELSHKYNGIKCENFRDCYKPELASGWKSVRNIGIKIVE